MTHLILFDGELRDHLLPLTFTRPVGHLRVGNLCLYEKWERRLGMTASFLTQSYLSELFPTIYGEHNLVINGSYLPTDQLVRMVKQLEPGTGYLEGDQLVAANLNEADLAALEGEGSLGHLQLFELTDNFPKITRPGDLFALNETELKRDFELLTAGRQSAQLPEGCRLVGPAENLFIEPDALIEPCIINAAAGPVYIGRRAKILAGAMLRGPLSVGKRAVVKMGAKIYGGTTIGPACKVGGEVNNVIFYANSNKGHDGYLGNSVVGEWCNFGADTNCSNLKNDYSEVRVWSYVDQRFVTSNRQFHGLIMADHAKCAINTMFNTGTVVGVFANVFSDGFPRPFIADFSWGGSTVYRLDKAFATAERVMSRRGQELDQAQRQMLSNVFEQTAKWRRG